MDLVNDEISLVSAMPVTINDNGFTITTNSTYNIDSNITVNSNNLGGSISKLLGDVFDITQSPKNIVIYELSDGSKLDTTRTYKLYRDDKIVGLTKEELGMYKFKGNEEELTPIRGRLYLNNLYKGSYKLLSSDNKSIEFSIDEDGNISGNVTENAKESSSRTSTSVAELIITIQTGNNKYYYLLLIIPIALIVLTLILLMRRTKKREQLSLQ